MSMLMMVVMAAGTSGRDSGIHAGGCFGGGLRVSVQCWSSFGLSLGGLCLFLGAE